MKVVSGAEMAAIDKRTIEEFGIPGQTLMEVAGRSVVDVIRAEYPAVRRLTVVCGPGNNGGDGFVIARTWHNLGLPVQVVLGAGERYKGDAEINFHRVRALGLPLSTELQPGDAIVDALFGTGLSRNVENPLVAEINTRSVPRIAVDIASGLDSATGEVFGVAVQADLTVTFGLPKIGHLLHPGASYTGRLVVREIGFPREYLEDAGLAGEWVTADAAAKWLPKRLPTGHKGTFGKVLLICGSGRYPGAAALCARGALRMGAGLVYVACPRSVAATVLTHNPEAIVLVSPGDPDRWTDGDMPWLAEQAKKKDAFCVGPGCAFHGFREFLGSHGLPPGVIDADALQGLPERFHFPVILTPHHGELLRMQAGSSNRLQTAREAAQRWHASLLLKGNPTLIASPEGLFRINSTGGPLLAQGGTGDVLSGALAALLAQGLDPGEAGALGAYLHGLSADLLGRGFGDRGLLAHELADGLPAAIRQVSVKKPGNSLSS